MGRTPLTRRPRRSHRCGDVACLELHPRISAPDSPSLYHLVLLDPWLLPVYPSRDPDPEECRNPCLSRPKLHSLEDPTHTQCRHLDDPLPDRGPDLEIRARFNDMDPLGSGLYLQQRPGDSARSLAPWDSPPEDG